MLLVRIGLEAAADFVTVHIRHHDIQKDDVGAGLESASLRAVAPLMATRTVYSPRRRSSKMRILAMVSSTTSTTVS